VYLDGIQRYSRVRLISFYILILVSIFVNGCGGGSGSGGGGSPSSNTPPEIISAPQLYAKANSSYNYEVHASDKEGDALTFSLKTLPTGMEIDPSTGRISWTPGSSQGGKNEVVVKVTDGKNEVTQSFTVSVQTSTVIVSKSILASTGGTIEVLDPTSEFLGSKVDIPAGALATDTTISLSKVSLPVFAPEGHPVLEIASNGSISSSEKSKKNFKLNISGRSVVVTIPYTSSFLQTYKIIDETKLKIFAGKSSNLPLLIRRWTALPNSCDSSAINSSCVNLSTKTITAKIDFDFETVTIGTDGILSGFQPRFFEKFSGNEDQFWKANPSDRNLLILHGIYSSADGFLGSNDVVQ
jgi:hypothetical protein